VRTHTRPASAIDHLTLTHGFEVAPGTTEPDAVKAHDAMAAHDHGDNGEPIWFEAAVLEANGVFLPQDAPQAMRTIARLTDPAERAGHWARQIERHRELMALAARLRRDEVGRVFEQTGADGHRTKGTPGSWPEVDRRLKLNPGRAYRIWNGND
jgi:hypothetical protein